MLRKFLLVSILSLSLAAFGQKGAGSSSGSSSSSSGNTSGASGAPVIPTTQNTTGGLAGQQAQAPGLNNPSQTDIGPATIPETMAGPAGTTGTTQANPANLPGTTGGTGGVGGFSGAGAPLLTTPGATFESVQPTAGISDAGRAGITDSTPLNTGLQSTLNTSTVVYTNGPVVVPPGAISPATAAVSARGPANDLGRSYYSDTIGGSPQGGASLAQVAEHYRSLRNTQNVKTYTNADIPAQNPGSLDNPTLAANIQPPAPRSSASSSPVPAPMPQTAPAPQSQTSSTSQQTSESQPAQTSTTPQVTESQPTTQNESTGLPATSTLLPLLGLLGIASSGIGLWYHRHRK
jgi:hypothetical protein